ncbi:MAG: hypothetical protein RLZZ574_2157, partial [Cyanobacteriota bacterium]
SDEKDSLTDPVLPVSRINHDIAAISANFSQTSPERTNLQSEKTRILSNSPETSIKLEDSTE